MKEISDAISTRLKSPLLGYSVFAFVAINWKPIFYVAISCDKVPVRLAYFDSHTSPQTLILLPVLFAVFMAIIYPWINFIFLLMARMPTDMKNSLQAKSEHNLQLVKLEMDKLRSNVLSSKERELIDRAKRDQELKDIENTKIRDDLQKQLEELRKKESNSQNKNSADDYESKMNTIIDTYSEIAQKAKEIGDHKKFEDYNIKAMRTQEELAERLLMDSWE